MPRNTFFGPKMVCAKMVICACNVRETPKTHMKPCIRRLVSIYGISWNIYQMLLVKLRNFIATKYPFCRKIWIKMSSCTYNIRKTPKSKYYQACINLWNSLEYLSHVASKAKKPLCHEITFLGQKWGSKYYLHL